MPTKEQEELSDDDDDWKQPASISETLPIPHWNVKEEKTRSDEAKR
jgi:hypothetical protein